MSWCIELRGVSKAFNERVVLRQISAKVCSPGAWTIVGPNGSGKSTLLRIIAGLVTPSGGEVVYLHNGIQLSATQRRQAIGMVAPDIALYRALSAIENLRFVARTRGLPCEEDELLGWLQRVGLRSRAYDRVATFSTGMVQRLKVVCALLHQPSVLLLDEPGSNLDEQGVAFIREVVEEQARRGIVIIATNDAREAAYGEPLVRLGA